MDAIAKADVLLEGFRPGVMERLGLGPADCHARAPGLVYARIVGWDRAGPWAPRAGHDINYIAMAGALHACGTDTVPLNLVGDLAAGALYAAAGIGAALHARAASGAGCVVDTAMTAGSLHLLTAVFARLGAGAWNDAPASNVIDGGVPWYRCYMTADGRHMAVGAIEERFYLQLLQGLGLEPATMPPRGDASRWPELAGMPAALLHCAGPGALGGALRAAGRLRHARAEPGAKPRAPAAPVRPGPKAGPRPYPDFTPRHFHPANRRHTMNDLQRRTFTTFALAAAAFGPTAALAQADYPNRPVRVVVPFTAGGVVDAIARLVGERLAARYSQPFVIENKTGAGGSIGTDFVAKSPADGYTLLCVSPGHAVVPSLVKGVTWNPVTDFPRGGGLWHHSQRDRGAPGCAGQNHGRAGGAGQGQAR
jgi:hypothetical protein